MKVVSSFSIPLKAKRMIAIVENPCERELCKYCSGRMEWNRASGDVVWLVMPSSRSVSPQSDVRAPSTVVSILIPLSREFVFVAPLLERRGREGELYNAAAARVRPPGLK